MAWRCSTRQPSGRRRDPARRFAQSRRLLSAVPDEAEAVVNRALLAQNPYSALASALHNYASALGRLAKTLETIRSVAEPVKTLPYSELANRVELEKLISGPKRNLSGIVGELRVLTTIPGVTRSNVPVQDLVADFRKSLAGAARNGVLLTTTELRALCKKEIDVVFDNGQSWGEIKNSGFVTLESLFRKPVTSKRVLRSIFEQAQFTRDLLNRIPPNQRSQQFHYFFANGIEDAAKTELERLGFAVHSMAPKAERQPNKAGVIRRLSVPENRK